MACSDRTGLRIAATAAITLSALLCPAAQADGPAPVDVNTLVEQGRAIRDHGLDTETLKGLLSTSDERMRRAESQARKFTDDRRRNDPVVRAMQPGDSGHHHMVEQRILIFASQSLGEQGMKDVLGIASRNPEAVVVLRGVPPGANFAAAILAVQQQAARFTPIPNIVIDPVLFRQYNVTEVPEIVVVPQTSASSPADTPQPLARVSGLYDPAWITREMAHGRSGDLGRKGPVTAISEPDLIEVAKKRALGIDWAKKKKEAVAQFWQHQDFLTLTPATHPRTIRVDPSILITQDITTPDGTVIAHQGDRINPLDARPFDEVVVVFDPRVTGQHALLERALPDIYKQSGTTHTVYIAVGLDKTAGWKGYERLTDRLNAPVFLLTKEIVSTFHLEHTPSVITADADRFIVRELATHSEATATTTEKSK